MHKLVLLRHGESAWNEGNRFCGWYDVGLSSNGLQEAWNAAEQLKKENFVFDVAHTSYLKRAIITLNIVLEHLDLAWIPVHKHWRLNERMYGALQGLNKAETAVKYGEKQVKIWRRSYSVAPPPVELSDDRWPGHEDKYKNVDKKVIPRTECLKDAAERFLPYWSDVIVPALKSGQSVFLCVHGSICRALLKHLCRLSDSDIEEVDIPNAIPLIFELDEDLNHVRHYFLGSEAQVRTAVAKIRKQGEIKNNVPTEIL